MIYHITTEEEWLAAKDNSIYFPQRFKVDGFIHASTKEQVTKIANTLYKNYSKVFLLCIDDYLEREFIKYENLEGGPEHYPHIYRKLPKKSIKKVIELFKTNNGVFDPLSYIHTE